jgi:aminoglycoside 3-N-acetyltransferase
MGSSPYIEVLIRHLYWKNIQFFSRFAKHKKLVDVESVNFSKVSEFLEDVGISSGDLLLVHSSYGNLKCFQKTPIEIIEGLIDIVGESGTIAMPAIREYEEELDLKNYLKTDLSETVCTYDLYNTRVQTGALPATMVKMRESVVSRFPLNTMVAIGRLAKPMMENNLRGELPTPCGENSSWKFCLDNNAYLVGLGTDLSGCLTMIHVAEDVLDDKWAIKNWYRKRVFKVVDKDSAVLKIIRERQPKWGALHWAGRTLCKDLADKKILLTKNIEGVLVEVIKAKELIDFLNSKNHKGYPYFWVKKHLK